MKIEYLIQTTSVRVLLNTETITIEDPVTQVLCIQLYERYLKPFHICVSCEGT